MPVLSWPPSILTVWNSEVVTKVPPSSGHNWETELDILALVPSRLIILVLGACVSSHQVGTHPLPVFTSSAAPRPAWEPSYALLLATWPPLYDPEPRRAHGCKNWWMLSLPEHLLSRGAFANGPATLSVYQIMMPELGMVPPFGFTQPHWGLKRLSQWRSGLCLSQVTVQHASKLAVSETLDSEALRPSSCQVHTAAPDGTHQSTKPFNWLLWEWTASTVVSNYLLQQPLQPISLFAVTSDFLR